MSLLNDVPVIFHKEIYAMASVTGGLIYWLLYILNFNASANAIISFIVICLIRFVAIRFHISLPLLHSED